MGTQSWMAAEFGGAELPDRRLRQGLYRNLKRLYRRRGESWSAALGPAGRQRARRHLSNRKQTVDGLLAGHYRQTGQRCQAAARRDGWVFVPCDTTPVDYRSHPSKADLGPISSATNSRGMFLHSALALTPSGEPLGLLGVQMWTRDPMGPGKETRRQRLPEEKESWKWVVSLQQIEERLPEGVRALLIDDREADEFVLFAAERRATTDLLVRAAQNRRVKLPESGEAKLLFEAAALAPGRGKRTVTVPRQAGRPARPAELTIRSRAVQLQPPQRLGMPPEPQLCWVVEAREEEPPEGEDGLLWVLLTTLDCDQVHDPVKVVGYYAQRWTVERYHYVLKSGMGIEQLQIKDWHPLQNAMALLAVVAWRTMALTQVAREEPGKPAAEVLDAADLTVLRAHSRKALDTIHDAVWAIACLAGYEPYHNGPPPGPKRVWLGLRRLEDMVAGFRLAQDEGGLHKI